MAKEKVLERATTAPDPVARLQASAQRARAAASSSMARVPRVVPPRVFQSGDAGLPPSQPLTLNAMSYGVLYFLYILTQRGGCLTIV